MIDYSMLQEFITEAGEHLDEMESDLLQLEVEPGNREILNDIFREVHSVKGAADYVGLERISELSHKLENLLEILRQGKLAISNNIIDTLIEARDRMALLNKDLETSKAENTEIADVVKEIDRLSGNEVEGGQEGQGAGSEEETTLSEGLQAADDEDDPVADDEGPPVEGGSEKAEEKGPDQDETDFFAGIPEFESNPEASVPEQKPVQASASEDIDLDSEEIGDDENYEEEYDSELFEIFIQQLLDNVSRIADKYGELKEGKDPGALLDEMAKNVESLRSSANYMGYERLVEIYSRWEKDLQSAKEDTAAGASPSYRFVNAYIRKLVVRFPRLNEIVSLEPVSREEGAEPEPEVAAEVPAGEQEDEFAQAVEEGFDLFGEDDSQVDVSEETSGEVAEEVPVEATADEPEEAPEPAAPSGPEDAGAEESELVAVVAAEPQDEDEDILPSAVEAPAEEEPEARVESEIEEVNLEDLELLLDDHKLYSKLDRAFDSALGDLVAPVPKGSVEEDLFSADQGALDQEALDEPVGGDEFEAAEEGPLVAEAAEEEAPEDEVPEGREAEAELAPEESFEAVPVEAVAEEEILAAEAEDEEAADVEETVETVEAAEVEEAAREGAKEGVSAEIGSVAAPEGPVAGVPEPEPEEGVEAPSEKREAVRDEAAEYKDISDMDVVEEGLSEEEEAEEGLSEEEAEELMAAGREAETDTEEEFVPQEIIDRRKSELLGERAVKQTLRVDSKKIDALMNQVGELVVSRAWFSQLFGEMREFQQYMKESMRMDKKEMKMVRGLTFRLSEATVNLGRVANELQESIMKVRMLPIANLFNRYPRMIRDLVKNSDKQIRLQVKGEDTELDKMMIEEISDPLVHIIRNAVDHGIETMAERRKAGKPETGVITLEAYHESNHVVVEVKDDGVGIDPAVVKAKALEKGFAKKEELAVMSRKEVIGLITKPGFSTKVQVTQTSGRGVGMDVVKKNVEKLNGNLEIDSVPGKQTQFRIKIPLTLAIIHALLVKVGDELFTIPLANVEETLRIFVDDTSTIEGVEVVHLRDQTLPLVRLSEVFGHNSNNRDEKKAFVVVVSTGIRRVGLVVDALIGQEEVVIKPLVDYLQENSGFSGATILGDGKISLILDVYELVNLTIDRRTRKLAAASFQIGTSALSPAERKGKAGAGRLPG